jgi:hypothetical protein
MTFVFMGVISLCLLFTKVLYIFFSGVNQEFCSERMKQCCALVPVTGVLTLWHTHTAVRRSEPTMFAFSSSFLPVDGMTCHVSF